MEHAVERKTISTCCRRRARWGLAPALFALFGLFATGAQAMLLTLDLRWHASSADALVENYHLQVGSIVQIIGFQEGTGDSWKSGVGAQFGAPYGQYTGEGESAAPYESGHVPDSTDVYLAENTQTNHTILYTTSIQQKGSDWYGVFTQITVDEWEYDRVYIRVFGATEFIQGEAIASYWAVSTVHTNTPSYYTDTLTVSDLKAEEKNYFEVIPEPATVGLLGMGGVALAAWRRRRFPRPDAGEARSEEE